MCLRNWSKYNPSLVQRGDFSLLCHSSVVKMIKKYQKKSRKPGRPPYPSVLIFILLLLKTSYNLSYRACEGMGRAIFSCRGIKIPSYSTICRGAQLLVKNLPLLSKRRPRCFMIDSSGFKISGEGEWKTKIHGKSHRRSWVKVHILVDEKTNEIIDLVLSSPSKSDISVGLHFLENMPKTVKKVLADGGYDGQRFRKLAYLKGVEALVPPPKNALLNTTPELSERNNAIRIISRLGDDRLARRIWGKLTGYCQRVKVESAFSRLKRIFGPNLYSRGALSQKVEIWLKALISNIWLNWAEI